MRRLGRKHTAAFKAKVAVAASKGDKTPAEKRGSVGPSVKYEHVYLHAYERVTVARAHLAGYFEFYNGELLHSSLSARPPDAA